MKLIIDIFLMIMKILAKEVGSAGDVLEVNKYECEDENYVHKISKLRIALLIITTSMCFIASFLLDNIALILISLLVTAISGWYTIKSIKRYNAWCDGTNDLYEWRKRKNKYEYTYDEYDYETKKERIKSYYSQENEGYEETNSETVNYKKEL